MASPASQVRCRSVVGSLAVSEVAAPIEMGDHLRSRQLIQRNPVAARAAKRAARPVGDLQSLLPLPAVGRQFGQGGVEVGHPVDQDRVFPP
jgi:hypothetical protein